MSRKRESNCIMISKKNVRIGKRIIEGGEPKLLCGSNTKKATFSLQEIAVVLYGPGTKCYVEQPEEEDN